MATCLVSGGTKTVLASAELYNPRAAVWTKTGSLHNARTGHTATLLHSRMVLDALWQREPRRISLAQSSTRHSSTW